MNAEAVVETIQLAIAPTVMISGCTLIQNGMLDRYDKIGTRLRSLNRERAELLSTDDAPEQVLREAVLLIDRQLVLLCRRHQLIQKTSLILYGAIALFLFSMLAIALTKLLNLGQFSLIALLLFLLGNTNLLVGVLLSGLEVYTSHQAVRSEVSGS